MYRLILPGIVLTCMFAVISGMAQDRPTYGELSEIKGKTKVYVQALAGDREAIIKGIGTKNALTVVSDPEDAEFFLSYETTSQKLVGSANFATGQMKVYLQFEKQQRILWFKEKTHGAFKNAVAKSLINDFLKQWKSVK